LKESKVISKVTGTLGTISKYTGDFLSLFTPGIITKPLYTASWILNSASNVAKLHGYSKPT
jgi:hypothetical protein